MASPNEKTEIIQKVRDFITTKYEGNYQNAFDAYDSDKDGFINQSELQTVIYAIGIPFMLRALVFHTVLVELDKNRDGKINFDEFNSYFNPS